MNSLSPWMPTILAFATTFVIASLVSGVTYWLARRPGVAMRWVRVAFSVLASLAALFSLVAIFASFNPLSGLYAILAVVTASGLQALIEGKIDGAAVAKKHQLARSFFTYLSTYCILYMMLAYAAAKIASSSPTSSVWSWNFSAIMWGLLVGLIIAPLSISFYRYMFQSLYLRPGIDRPLQEGELTG